MTPRPNFLGYTVLAAFGLGLVYIAVSEASDGDESDAVVSRKVVGLPRGRASFAIPETGVPLPIPMLDGAPLKPLAGDNDSAGLARVHEFTKLVQAEFANRRRALPADADPNYPDKYSKGMWPLPTWIVLPNATAQQVITSNWRLFDEFGRGKSGHVGFGGSITDSFSRLLANPLASATIAAAAFAFGGPAGLAAYGAINAYVIRGEEISAESVALTAARTYAVSQCGPACGAAFDVGVGIASGDSVDKIAEDALLGQMSADERAYYEQGKELYREVA